MSNACETNTNVRNLEFTGTFENEYKSSNSYCLRASVPANETIYVLSKDRYDLLKACNGGGSGGSGSGGRSSKCSCNTWIIVAVSFIIITILLIIVIAILGSKLLKKK
jgi:hypothetical protein